MKAYLSKIIAFVNDEEGAVAVEYALLIGLVSVALVAALVALGPKLVTFVEGINFTATGS